MELATPLANPLRLIKYMKSIYYDYNPICSYRQPIKMIVGGEGIGKTYGLKERLLRLRDESEEPFEIMWFIRYDVDITPIYIQKWQDDLPIDIKQRITVDGHILKVDDEPFCYFRALSKFIVGKGIPYPNVKHCVFDEFILDKDSRYLPNEIFAFKRWTQSVFRLRKVSWWLMANSLSFDNPYFNYFKVKKEKDKEWFSNDKVVVHFPRSNKNFKKVAMQADYYRLFNDDETMRYGLEGEFYFDNEEFISSQPFASQPKFNLKVNKNVYGLWSNKETFWLSSSPCAKLKTYAIDRADTNTSTIYIAQIKKILQEMYTGGHLYFHNLTIKNEFLEKIKCL